VSDRPAQAGCSVAIPAHVHVRAVADELVILSLESEEYFGLDPVGARLWQLLESHGTVRGAFEAALSEYDVDQATLARDLDQLLAELASRRLIDVVDAP
jgi:hypothetical protein